MNQREALTEGFLRWLETVVVSNRVSQGAKLDPFATSTRAVHNWVPALSAVRAGLPIPTEPDARQKLVDLRQAAVMDGDSPEQATLLPLGDRVEAKWSALGILNQDLKYNLARCVVVMKEAMALREHQYRSYWDFWVELRDLRPPEEWFADPFNLCLVSYLNRQLGGYNPFRVLVASGSTFSDDDLPRQVWIDWCNDLPTGPARANFEKLLRAVDELAPRAKAGRVELCRAMELIYLDQAGDVEVPSILKKWGLFV